MNRIHRDQQGAVAMLVMAALLAVFLLSIVIYDATFASRQKVDVQAAADSAAWSQSAVEARSMNMIVLANVGKRITIGMAVFYKALWAAWAIVLGITVVLLIAAAIACYFGVGCPAMEFLIKVVAEIADIMASEGEDLGDFRNDIKDYLEADVKAFDDYQAYMQKITPWWGWSEATIRGYRNGALSVGTFPVPGNISGEVSLGSGIDDDLPIEKDSDYEQLCKRSVNPDAFVHLADYGVKTLTCDECLDEIVASNGTREVLYAAAGGIALGLYYGLCEEFAGSFGVTGRPYHMKEYTEEAPWLLDSSNLVFSYQPGVDHSGERRQKYDFLTRDYTYSNFWGEALYKSDGFFGMARSEISFQTNADSPDLWHASWTARMRPIAFPGEWEAYEGDTRLVTAFHDVLPYMVASSAIISLLGGAVTTPDLEDALRIEMAIDALTNDFVDGLPR